MILYTIGAELSNELWLLLLSRTIFPRLNNCLNFSPVVFLLASYELFSNPSLNSPPVFFSFFFF